MFSMSNFTVPSLQGHSMIRKETRIDATKTSSTSNIRELRREAAHLDRKDKQLFGQVKQMVGRRDIAKAQILARQMAVYRNTSNVAFRRSTILETDCQVCPR